MQGKIALEEHFAIPETAEDSVGYFPEAVQREVRERNADIHGRRLALMDEYGIEMMILSLNAPAVQAIADTARAAEVARKANDFLAEQVRKRPGRFAGFAALAMQDPEIAARELERCVKELGLCGALVNGFSQAGDADTVLYYDLPAYRPFWATVEKLDVPFYLHPRNPVPRDSRIYDGHPWLMGPIWAFGQETAVHALRLMASGLFDAHPRLNIILGHMGENLPYGIWRVDNSNAWIPNRNKWPAKKRLREYFSANFFLTTSGNFRTQALMNAMLEIGADRIMFSTDWPFENIDHAANWFDSCPISENDRLKIGRGNARRLFKLGNE
jgi:2,3-dihydroxybenzoate decarboxylase